MKKRVALVLSGGSARGIAHIGAIEELERNGFEIKSIAGTSMGALVGGVYGLGKLEEFKNWLFTLDKFKVFSLVDFTLSAQGLIKGDKVFNRMKEFITDSEIEDLEIDYAAIATDIKNKKEVVFKSGSIYNAIRASIAIPTVFTPVKKDGQLLVDGGVLNNIPVEHVSRSRRDILVVVNVNANKAIEKPKFTEKESEEQTSIYQKKLKEFYQHLNIFHNNHKEEKLGYFDLINETLGMMINRINQEALNKYKPDIMIEVSRDACGMFDFYKAEELVEMGRLAAKDSIEKYISKKSLFR
ncbi:MAG: patatin-like phospholipase family protein [Bacteroidales bacterium]|nr:patatin-like phospholipase family protein [Bacteroidales bacterium]MBN2818923.1 patatin-like phospholipase family protein [Bacteroidales bacterium]